MQHKQIIKHSVHYSVREVFLENPVAMFRLSEDLGWFVSASLRREEPPRLIQSFAGEGEGSAPLQSCERKEGVDPEDRAAYCICACLLGESG